MDRRWRYCPIKYSRTRCGNEWRCWIPGQWRRAAADKGDILAKYDPEVFGPPKKEPGINPRIFLSVEQITGNANYKEEEDAFVFSDGSDSESEDSEEGSGSGIVDKRNKVNHRANGRSAPAEALLVRFDIDAI